MTTTRPKLKPQFALMTAGLGTRLEPFTKIWPKPFVPILANPLLQWTLDVLNGGGFTTGAANFSYRPDLFKLNWEKLDLLEMNISLSDESKLILGSGGGVATMASLLEGSPLLYVAGDILFDFDLGAFLETHKRAVKDTGATITLALFKPAAEDGGFTEVFLKDPTSQTGKVSDLGPYGAAKAKPAFSGIAFLEREALLGLKPKAPYDFVKDILRPAITRHQVSYHLGLRFWAEVGTPLSWYRAHEKLAAYLQTKSAPDFWKNRLRASLQELKPGCWGDQSVSALQNISLEAPCFISGLHGSTLPLTLGPRALVYGRLKEQNLKNAISVCDQSHAFTFALDGMGPDLRR